MILATFRLKDSSNHEAKMSHLHFLDHVYLHHEYGRAGNSVPYPQHYDLLDSKGSSIPQIMLNFAKSLLTCLPSPTRSCVRIDKP